MTRKARDGSRYGKPHVYLYRGVWHLFTAGDFFRHYQWRSFWSVGGPYPKHIRADSVRGLQGKVACR